MKGLWCKWEDLSSDPQNRCKAGCGGTCLQSQHPMLGIGVYKAESPEARGQRVWHISRAAVLAWFSVAVTKGLRGGRAYVSLHFQVTGHQ